MKISRREMLIGILTLFIALFGLTYWLGGSRIAEHKAIIEEKEKLLRQIQLHKRIIAEQGSWTNRLSELQSQLPVYDRKVSVTGEILKEIKSMADGTGLDLTKSRANREKQVGTLYELSVICDWEGELEELVRFLYQVNEQGLRFDIRELSVRPDAKRAGILRGDMIIDCAYRRSDEAASAN
ncbi:hypothetical protein [Tichowtungia aerotolerans]|uniref:Type 4a pilus biogenesis protein PilO n=1 Tax=Tichowtungia aerotolerans TaxID=2697043 RepID=A0A6P1M6N5_9BACT|nr:hypothetical protein [Tichowtungia aerotolerans]QHI70459.1 hypothetical protein GT409_13765 [Tichowtungia aerotolerans]